jgi:2-C-methyl-D-erythritol 4-phosphate cytidylyltransferase
MPDSARYWAVVPAAGVGSRMAIDTPKQYLPLAGRTVIEWSLQSLLNCASVERVIVAIAPGDVHWPTLACASNARVRTAIGGAERASSVLNGLNALSADAHENDWVLVHDAARPCLMHDDLMRLLDELASDPVGGLLAVPVADTLKAADSEQRVSKTVPREHLWRALTPQMFRYGVLRRALQTAEEKGIAVTDESSAVEALGFKPRLIAGRADNIKITVPEDLQTAERILQARKN